MIGRRAFLGGSLAVTAATLLTRENGGESKGSVPEQSRTVKATARQDGQNVPPSNYDYYAGGGYEWRVPQWYVDDLDAKLAALREGFP